MIDRRCMLDGMLTDFSDQRIVDKLMSLQFLDATLEWPAQDSREFLNISQHYYGDAWVFPLLDV